MTSSSATHETAPRRGRRFLHAHQITKGSTAKAPVPETCEVTRVTQHAVYFKNSTGAKSVADRNRFASSVLRWLDEEPAPAADVEALVKLFKETWKRGLRAYDAGDYAAALALYEQARDMLPEGHGARSGLGCAMRALREKVNGQR